MGVSSKTFLVRRGSLTKGGRGGVQRSGKNSYQILGKLGLIWAQTLKSDSADSNSKATGTQPLPPAPAKVWFHFNVFSSSRTNWIFY